MSWHLADQIRLMEERRLRIEDRERFRTLLKECETLCGDPQATMANMLQLPHVQPRVAEFLLLAVRIATEAVKQ